MSQQQFQLKALIMGVDKLSPQLKKIQRNLNGFRKSLNKFGAGGVQMAAGLGIAVGVTAKAFADSEHATLSLKSAMMGIGGTVSPEFEKINQLALKLGNKLPGNTADFKNMMRVLTQQGVGAKDILGGIGEATAYLAVQLQMAPEQAAVFAAKMKMATGTTSKDMMSLMDVIQRTSNLGVGTGDMLQGFSKLKPVLSILKIKGLEASKALAPLLAMSIKGGMAGESAGNAYRKMFSSFFDPKKMGKANAMLSKKGMGLDFTNGKGEFGGMDKMFAQLSKLKKLTTAERVPLLQALFGDDSETLNIVTDMIDLGKAGYDDMDGQMKAQANLQKRVGVLLTGLTNIYDSMLGNLSNLLAKIGETFSEEMKSLGNSLADFAAWAQTFVKDNPNVIRAILAVVTALSTLMVGALALAGVIKILSASMLMNPIGLALVAIAIAAGLVIAYWGPISGFFKNMWNSITTFFENGYYGIRLIVKNMMSVLQPLFDGIALVGGSISSFFDGDGAAPSMQGNKNAAQSLAQGKGMASGQLIQRQSIGGSLDVRFANAPQGTRVDAQSNTSGFAINPDVGYNSFAMGAL